MTQLKYTADELKEAIFGPEGYFATKEQERKDKDSDLVYMSISDICCHLDISSRTWRNYRKKPSHFPVIKRAEEIIANEWKKNLFYPGRNATGAIFYAKNVWGWSDKQEVEHSGQVEHTHSPKLEELDTETLDKLRAAFDDNQEDQVIDVTED